MASSSLLLVEDEPDSRTSLALGLQRAGYLCVTAATYDEAIQASSAGIYAACVVDIALGVDEIAGLRLIPHLRMLSGRPPVVVVTGFADVAKVKHALNAGAAHFLEKPFRTADLVDVVRRLIAAPSELTRCVDLAVARAKLTEREDVVARLVLKGLSSAEIASVEGLLETSVRRVLARVFTKCGVSTRAELFHFVFPS